MSIDANDSIEFSWPKALGHSLAIGAVFFLPAIAFSVAGAVNATKAGEFSADFIIPALILGWIWSYAHQRKRNAVAQFFVVILVAMSAFEVFVLAAAAATRGKTPPVSSLERRPPTSQPTAEGPVLCQQDIGLRLPLNATGLTLAPDLAATLKKKDPDDAIARWVYRDSSNDIVVLMGATGFDSEESLRNFLQGTSRAAEGRLVKTHESVQWNDGKGSIDVSFRQGDASHFEMRCVSAANGNLACIQTIGAGPDRLAALRNGLSLDACP